MTTQWDVIVVGGGLAGLTAGATAAKAGASAVVLEAHRPGGRARTHEKDGFVFNMGGHALYAGSSGMPVLRELGVSPTGSQPPLKEYKMLIDGELHAMPFSAGSLMRTSALSARSKAALGRLLAGLGRMRPAEFAEVSVAAWLDDQGLRPDARRVIEGLIRTGSYTDQFEDLSAEAALVQLKSSAAAGVLYLDGGWGPMLSALESMVEVRECAGVTSVAEDGAGVEVTLADGTRLAGRAAVVAAGTPAAVRSILPDAPDWGDLGDPVVAACLDLGVRGVPTPGYVVSCDDPVFATRQSPPARQAPEGDAVLAVLRYGNGGAAEDRALMERYVRLAGVDESAVVVDRFLARMSVTGAMPLARNGGLAGRPRIDATGSRRVFMAGDWVGPDGVLADASLSSGHAAALAAVRAGERSATMVA